MYKTKKEATEAWVNTWNFIPTNLVRDYIHEGLQNGSVEQLTFKGEECHYSDTLWGDVFTFKERIDEERVRNNAEEVEKLGIIVYDSDVAGIIMAIDGGGYNFVDEHFIPLYDLLGYQWHEEE